MDLPTAVTFWLTAEKDLQILTQRRHSEQNQMMWINKRRERDRWRARVVQLYAEWPWCEPRLERLLHKPFVD